MKPESYTNTSLATARRCAREYDLGYVHRLEVASEEEREALAVGQAWHRAFDAAQKAGDDAAGFEAIARHAPGVLWRVKLARMFAAHRWYWQDDGLRVLEAERKFRVNLGDSIFDGVIDAIVELDGRRGILERKTTADALEAGASYWKRLRLDVQTGLYYLAAKAEGWEPSFILYDVARKPGIRPKTPGTKKERLVWRAQLEAHGAAAYYGELFDASVFGPCLEAEQESPDLFGARLTAEIGNEPERYFRREPVNRTTGDFLELIRDLESQVDALERAHERGHFPRNPEACDAFGTCRFFPLCSVNAYPAEGTLPDGFQRREKLHPELEDIRPAH